MSEWYPPSYGEEAFHCPLCQVYAKQNWHNAQLARGRGGIELVGKELRASRCVHCSEPSLWLGEKILYPNTGHSPAANSDLPEDVKKIYAEAGTIAQLSPRSACALLRLAVEMLLKHLGQSGTINDGIARLVEKGLDPTIQQALDTLRVTGNEAVHPGVIDFNDRTVVHPLFEMINIIADALISQPKRIQETYDKMLSEPAKEAISRRDKGTP